MFPTGGDTCARCQEADALIADEAQKLCHFCANNLEEHAIDEEEMKEKPEKKRRRVSAWELSLPQMLEMRKDPKLALRMLTQAMVIRALTDKEFVKDNDLEDTGVQIILPPNTDVEEMKKVMQPLYGDVLFFTEGKEHHLSVPVPDLKDAGDFHTYHAF